MKNFFKLFCLIFCIFLFNTTVFAKEYTEIKLNYDNKIENYKQEKVHIFINDKEIEQFNMPPIILNGRTLVPLRDVFENMGADVFWDNVNKKVTIEKNGIKLEFFINNNFGIKNSIEKFYFDVPSKIINDYTMVPIRAISTALNYDVTWDSEERNVIIKEILQETTETTTQIITEQVSQETSQENFESNNENFSSKKDGIKIVWDQISNPNANDTDIKRKTIDGLDVISPTWFEIINENGDIKDKGSLDYSNWAKEQGYQIWGLITNGFSSKITHSVLSNANKRQKLIYDIVTLAQKYNLDGINIDFESVAKEDGVYYLQFIKEATPILKQNNLIVSVDMYVPTKWTEHYRMKEVAQIVDYVIIMAYDEHHSNSKVSGSVSSIPWLDLHMQKASELVPKDKLIMGVPFYTRVWTETKDGKGNISVVSKSLKMQEAINLLKENNANIFWDEKTGQYYGEYFSNNTTKKIWLEEEKSIEERMKIAHKYDVKGVAFWKRGHEKEGIWDIINKYYE